MAEIKITQLPEKVNVIDDDWIEIVDTEDLTESPQGTSKKAKKVNILYTPTLDEVCTQGNFTNSNIGIGTTSPAANLHLLKSEFNSDDIFKIQHNFINPFPVPPGTTTDFIIKSTGNVGIGTTNPASRLHVNSGATNEIARFESSDKGAYISIMDSDTTSSFQGIGSEADDLVLLANNKEYVRILANGNVGIREDFPVYDLDVSGEGRFTGDVRGLSFITTSQRDQKEGITDITKTKAKAIPFKEYTYKSSIDGSARKRYGVIAEDIENEYPELVHTGADGVKGINYIDLLVKRVAELEKELEDISLTPGATGPQGPSGSNGNDGNSHLSNVDSITFDERANQLVLTINRTDFRFNPAR